MAIATLDPAHKAPTSASAEFLDEAALQDQQEEWADADDEGGDGGEAVTIARAEFDHSLSKGRKADERALQRNRNQGRLSRASNTFGPSHASAVKGTYTDMTTQESNPLPKPTGSVLPHLRGLPKSKEPTSQAQRPGASTSLSKQVQKRLVIMDDEEYGM